MAADQVMPGIGHEASADPTAWWDRPAAAPVNLRTIPWDAPPPEDPRGTAEMRLRDFTQAALTLTPTGSRDVSARAGAFVTPGPLLGLNQPGVSTATGGGIKALEGLYGNQQTYGQDGLTDRGLVRLGG